MQPTGTSVHKAGPFKQQNKEHKTGRHRSKGSVDAEFRGKSVKAVTNKPASKLKSRKDKRNQLAQLRKNKRAKTVEIKRRFGGENGSLPILVTTISLSADVYAEDFVSKLRHAVSSNESFAITCRDNITTIRNAAQKKCFSFVTPNAANLIDILDSLKVSDVVLFIWPLDGMLSPANETLLTTIFGHGFPTAVHVTEGLKTMTSKRKHDYRKNVVQHLTRWAFEPRLHSTDLDSDFLVLLRNLGEMNRTPSRLQANRAHLLVESFTLEDDVACASNDSKLLKLYGYVRGNALDANSLIHLVGIGDFQMQKIEVFANPSRQQSKEVVKEWTCISAVTPQSDLQETLQSEVGPSLEDQEQVLEDKNGGISLIVDGKVKKAKLVPKGTSEYQAAWIADAHDADGSGEESTSEDGDAEMQDDEGSEADESNSESGDDDEEAECVEEMDAVSESADHETYDQKMDDAEDESRIALFRRERENELFPDEIDTPLDVPARVRFQKYRGLKSFRTSTWNTLENLPFDYARIYQFENFGHTRKAVLSKQPCDKAVSVGSYVCVHAIIPIDVLNNVQSTQNLIAYFPLSYEQKMSTLNMVIRRVASCSVPVESKENLVFHVGYRRFEASAIFSQHTIGDKHKFERFLPAKAACVATVYAPITFPPASVLVFRKSASGSEELVATGSVLDANPMRIVLKRVVLSGHPFKSFQRSAVVRYMFFNRDDVLWFKPIELFSKYGLKGHIREAVGTHGHMKCTFDRPVNSQDSILMKLYKRVFPKWTYKALN